MDRETVDQTVDFDIGSLKVECHWVLLLDGVRQPRTRCGKVPSCEQHHHSQVLPIPAKLPPYCPDCGAKTCEACAAVAARD